MTHSKDLKSVSFSLTSSIRVPSMAGDWADVSTEKDFFSHFKIIFLSKTNKKY